jgi:hypothetical protein
MRMDPLCVWRDFVNEYEDRLFRCQFNALADNVYELSNGQILEKKH